MPIDPFRCGLILDRSEISAIFQIENFENFEKKNENFEIDSNFGIEFDSAFNFRNTRFVSAIFAWLANVENAKFWRVMYGRGRNPERR